MNKPNTIPRRPSKLGEVGLERFAPYLMNRIMGRYNESLRDTLLEQGLTTVQMRALAVLSVNDGLMINELTVFAVSEQSTMSRTLDQMEKIDLIERRPDENDNRARRIFLTQSGRVLFDDLWPSIVDAESSMFDGVDENERDAFLATLGKVLRNVRRNEI